MGKLRNISKIITYLMSIKKGKSIKHLAEEKDINEQSLRNKLSRASHTAADLIEYALYLGVDVGFKDGDNFYSFIDEDLKESLTKK